MKSSVIFLIVASLLTAGVSSAEDIIVPESWAGIWETTTTEMDCQTLDVISVTTTLDTLCAGDIFNLDDPEFGVVCSGSVTDVAVHLECSATTEILPDCSLSLSFVSDGTRSGETSSGVSVTSFTYTGTGCFFEDTCVRQETSAVRTGDDPDCGPTPVSETGWGSLKSLYR